MTTTATDITDTETAIVVLLQSHSELKNKVIKNKDLKTYFDDSSVLSDPVSELAIPPVEVVSGLTLGIPVVFIDSTPSVAVTGREEPVSVNWDAGSTCDTDEAEDAVVGVVTAEADVMAEDPGSEADEVADEIESVAPLGEEAAPDDDAGSILLDWPDDIDDRVDGAEAEMDEDDPGGAAGPGSLISQFVVQIDKELLTAPQSTQSNRYRGRYTSGTARCSCYSRWRS